MLFAQIVKEGEPNTLKDIEPVFENILKSATAIVGLGVFAMLVVGAFKLLTAGSNQETAQKAKNTFTFAAMGAAAVIVVWFLFVFLKDYTGIDIFQFSICIVNDNFCNP